jgi:poly-gamma-glutamate capsule biosynthesis protein CapA/YwtB (metallophosphatase superfamily)
MSSREKIQLAAVGDMMLTREVGRMIDERGPEFPFERVRSILRTSDIVFGNLECAITDRGTPHPKKDPHVTFRAVARAAEGLKTAGFNMISVANNHIVDYGNEGLLDTLEILERNGIKPVGAGRNEREARKPTVLTKKGIRVAFLAYTSAFGVGLYTASPSSPGPAHLSWEKVCKDIKIAKKESDFVIVSLHWGLDYVDYPVPFQMRMARKMIETGANLILGHGPHFIQGIENHSGGLIVYSLGDFIFDEPMPKSKEALIFRCELGDGKILSHEEIPIILNTNYQAVVAPGEKKEEILSRLEALSASCMKLPREIANENDYTYLAQIFRMRLLGCSKDYLKNFHFSLISFSLLRTVISRLRWKHLGSFFKYLALIMK